MPVLARKAQAQRTPIRQPHASRALYMHDERFGGAFQIAEFEVAAIQRALFDLLAYVIGYKRAIGLARTSMISRPAVRAIFIRNQNEIVRERVDRNLEPFRRLERSRQFRLEIAGDDSAFRLRNDTVYAEILFEELTRGLSGRIFAKRGRPSANEGRSSKRFPPTTGTPSAQRYGRRRPSLRGPRSSRAPSRAANFRHGRTASATTV